MKFKVGDKVRNKVTGYICFVCDEAEIVGDGMYVGVGDSNNHLEAFVREYNLELIEEEPEYISLGETTDGEIKYCPKTKKIGIDFKKETECEHEEANTAKILKTGDKALFWDDDDTEQYEYEFVQKHSGTYIAYCGRCENGIGMYEGYKNCEPLPKAPSKEEALEEIEEVKRLNRSNLVAESEILRKLETIKAYIESK